MLFPTCYGLPDLPQNRFRCGRLESEKWSHFKSQIEAQRVVGFGNIETQPRAIGIRIQVVGGREFPTTLGKQEAVVAEVIVGVVNSDGKDDAPP